MQTNLGNGRAKGSRILIASSQTSGRYKPHLTPKFMPLLKGLTLPGNKSCWGDSHVADWPRLLRSQGCVAFDCQREHKEANGSKEGHQDNVLLWNYETKYVTKRLLMLSLSLFGFIWTSLIACRYRWVGCQQIRLAFDVLSGGGPSSWVFDCRPRPLHSFVPLHCPHHVCHKYVESFLLWTMVGRVFINIVSV
jgi:hypothetical protein